MTISTILYLLSLFVLTSFSAAQSGSPIPGLSLCADPSGFEDCLAKSKAREAACNGAAFCICAELGQKRGLCGLQCMERASTVAIATAKQLQPLLKECASGLSSARIPKQLPPALSKPMVGSTKTPADATDESDTQSTLADDGSSTELASTKVEGEGGEEEGQSNNSKSSGLQLTSRAMFAVAVAVICSVM
jgi:hypothetical protein